MLVFIDESGDPGFKAGSSSNFVIAMVIFDDYEGADNARDAISKLMIELNHKPEFRFSRCSSAMRTKFFEHIAPYDFRIRAIIAAKDDIESHHLRHKPREFYNYILKQLISHNELDAAQLRVDGDAKREFLKAARSYLRKEAPKGAIKNVKYLDSKKDTLIQLADMITGAIARSHNKNAKANADKWHGMLEDKIEDIWLFK